MNRDGEWLMELCAEAVSASFKERLCRLHLGGRVGVGGCLAVDWEAPCGDCLMAV